MRRDHMIALGLYLIEMGILKAPWYYEAGGDARAAAFADNLIRPIYGRLVRTILRMLWAGYSPGAKRYKFIQPNWVYFQGGESKKVWDNGNIDAVVYRPVLPLKPELCRPRWKSGEFNGIKYDGNYGGGSFVLDGFQSQEIDLVRSMWITHGAEGEDNNIYGFPRIAHCAPIFYEYWRMWDLVARAFENNADPGPIVRYPQSEPSLSDVGGSKVTPVRTALTIGKRRRSGSTVAMPSDPYTTFDDRPSTMTKWGIEYPENKTDFENMMNWIGQLESAKLIGMWIPPEGATGANVTGSSSNRNTVSELSDLRDEAQFVLMQTIDEFIDNVFVRPAFAMNMPQFEGTIRKVTLGLSQDDEDTVRQFFQLVGQQDWRNFGVDVQKLAEVRRLPMLDPAERERQLQAQASQAEQGGPPVVTPTEGRRAMVTQTGFGETVYEQLENYGDAVVLADDGDFVAGLPRTDHFADKAVLAQARLLRRHANIHYAALYEDFARYVAKRRQLGLAEGGSWVDRLVNGWKPRAERTRMFSDRIKKVLGAVFDRTAALKALDLTSKQRASISANTRAARWLEAHGAELVSGVTDTVRDDLRTFLAGQVEKGSTSKQVAAAVRANFSDFPDWQADRLARTEVTSAFNFATLSAGEVAGVKQVQLVDGNDDAPCRSRNGRVISLKDAFKEELAHPRCVLTMRLLPPSTALEVRRESLDDGLLARFDEETGVVLLSSALDAEDERAYMLALGERLSLNGHSASTNGNHAREIALAADER